jgi:hypothetical protein
MAENRRADDRDAPEGIERKQIEIAAHVSPPSDPYCRSAFARHA